MNQGNINNSDQPTPEYNELNLLANEFTLREIVAYMNAAYGSHLSRCPFTSSNIARWLQLKRLPQAYGGHKISRVYKSGISIFTIEGLSREDFHYIRQTPLPTRPKLALPKRQRKPPRTKLYYQLAGRSFKGAINMLPDNWKDVGIRGNQLINRKNKKKQLKQNKKG